MMLKCFIFSAVVFSSSILGLSNDFEDMYDDSSIYEILYPTQQVDEPMSDYIDFETPEVSSQIPDQVLDERLRLEIDDDENQHTDVSRIGISEALWNEYSETSSRIAAVRMSHEFESIMKTYHESFSRIELSGFFVDRVFEVNPIRASTDDVFLQKIIQSSNRSLLLAYTFFLSSISNLNDNESSSILRGVASLADKNSGHLECIIKGSLMPGVLGIDEPFQMNRIVIPLSNIHFNKFYLILCIFQKFNFLYGLSSIDKGTCIERLNNMDIDHLSFLVSDQVLSFELSALSIENRFTFFNRLYEQSQIPE